MRSQPVDWQDTENAGTDNKQKGLPLLAGHFTARSE